MNQFVRNVTVTVILAFVSALTFAKNIDVNVFPGNWWTKMKTNTITLTASAEFTGQAFATINYPGIKILKTYPGESNHYLFIDIEITKQATAGSAPITFRDSKGNSGSFEFTIQDRNAYQPQALTNQDIIYQIVADRFRNGNTKNDNINGYFEVSDRLNPMGIHGGDFHGITQSIDYIKSFGFTCIDILPVYESNLMALSYQRNGITNSYKIDKRLGSIKDYQELINKCHLNNIKVTQTMVFHQLGKYNEWNQIPPFTSFFHNPELKYSTDQKLIPSDPYASEHDKDLALGTWQELNMPAVNQRDERLQKQLIQNCIWWLETSKADILKIDEINRNSPDFLAKLFKAIYREYPSLSIISDHSASDTNINFWQNLAIDAGFSKTQIHISDYPLALALDDAFSVYREGDEGLQDLYATVTEDYKYANPMGNVVMADNHQLTRMFSNADKDFNQAKMMLGYLLTTRGIPSIFYGTEWLLDGTINKGKGFVRKDFPGGWPGDTKNGFTQKGFSIQENDFFNYFTRLVKWRKENQSLFDGKFIQFAPKDGIYAYYRKKDSNAAFILINNTESTIRIDQNTYKEILDQYSKGYDIVSESTFDDFSNLLLGAKSILILQLKN
nr:alpha-amylase family glycosyl hydrolase [uncultured Carboxylicivirga sp.]